MPPHASGWDGYWTLRLTSTAALALSNSSSRDWFLDRSVLPHLWSLLKRPCQTHVHNVGVRENTVSRLSDRRKGPALANPSRRRRGEMPASATQGFLFLSIPLLFASLSYPRCCCPHLTFSHAHNASGLTCHAVTFTHFSRYANLKIAWQETFAQRDLSIRTTFGNVQYTQDMLHMRQSHSFWLRCCSCIPPTKKSQA